MKIYQEQHEHRTHTSNLTVTTCKKTLITKMAEETGTVLVGGAYAQMNAKMLVPFQDDFLKYCIDAY